MKLITEQCFDNVKYLVEDTKSGNKNFYISGVFMQSEVVNRNGRLYPKEILMREADRYIRESIRQNRALGELGHPDSPSINLERVSHIITDLKIEGNDIVGKAKLLSTPYGEIAKSFVKEGIKLGVSTRGLGSLRETGEYNEVQEDFNLAAVDIVAEPSAPNAFVNGIMEGREWIYENGIIKEVEIERYKKAIKKAKAKELEQVTLKIFEDFLKKLK